MGKTVVARIFPTLFRGLRPGSGDAFAFAFLFVELATFARFALEGIGSANAIPYITYFPAILLATFFCGFWAGWMALVGSVVLTFSLQGPGFVFRVPSASDLATLAVFVVIASIIVGATEHYRQLMNGIQDQEHFRHMLMRDLEHRMKNKLATIDVIVRHSLEDHPDLLGKVRGRLATLAAADDFVAREKGRGVYLKDILGQEFAPFGAAQFRMACGNLFLPAKPATMLALLLHELATNAAKYGALASPKGVVAVDSKVEGPNVIIHWTERGGPPVTRPVRVGFGTLLLERGLTPYCGKTDLRFEREGLAATISFTLQDERRQ